MRQRRNKRKFKNYLLDDLKMLSKILSVFIVILLIIFIYSSIKVKQSSFNIAKTNSTNIDSSNTNELSVNENGSDSNSNVENTTNKKIVETAPQDTTIDMAITGDIMCHNTIFNDAFNSSSNSYDFSYIFDDIKYNIQTADIAVGNLETTFAGPQKEYSGYPTFNTPESLAYNLKKLGFDVLSTANNHCYDKGYSRN